MRPILSRLPLITSRVRHSSSLPRIAQPALWKSLVPSLPSRSQRPASVSRTGGFWRNPITTVFILALVVGSQSIHIIQLRNQNEEFEQWAEWKLAKLGEVLRRVQEGEDLDIKEEMGTEDWDKVLELVKNNKTLPDKSRTARQRKKERQLASKTHSALDGGGESAESAESGDVNDVGKKPAFY